MAKSFRCNKTRPPKKAALYLLPRFTTSRGCIELSRHAKFEFVEPVVAEQILKLLHSYKKSRKVYLKFYFI